MGTITISHDHENGTRITGSTRGDGVWEIAKRFRFQPNRSIGLVRPGSRDRIAKRQLINDCAEALRAAGFQVDVHIDDTPRDRTTVLADQADRLDTRHDRLAGKANRLFRKADAHHATADYVSKRRPAGQPILEDHHSARRARKDQATIDDNLHAYHDVHDHAVKVQRRADAVGTDADYAESPHATVLRIPRLEKELRDIDKQLDGHTTECGFHPPASGERRESLLARRAQLEDQLKYDRGILDRAEAEGRWVRYSQETVQPGDLVSVFAEGSDWRIVVKANKATVAVETGYSWTAKLPYAKIRRHHRSAEKTDAGTEAPGRQ